MGCGWDDELGMRGIGKFWIRGLLEFVSIDKMWEKRKGILRTVIMDLEFGAKKRKNETTGRQAAVSEWNARIVLPRRSAFF